MVWPRTRFYSLAAGALLNLRERGNQAPASEEEEEEE
jgi:hypothetical protein